MEEESIERLYITVSCLVIAVTICLLILLGVIVSTHIESARR